MAVLFKLPQGVTDKNIESTLDKIQNAIQKFGTDVDANSVEFDNKKELLNNLATELYNFDIQLQEFKDNFSDKTENELDDEEVAEVRTQLAEFQNKIVKNKFDIEEANTLISNLADFFGKAVEIYAEESPEGGAEEQTIAERNAAAEEEEEAIKKAIESAGTGKTEEIVKSLSDNLENINADIPKLEELIPKYMAKDLGANEPWIFTESEKNTVEGPLISNFDKLGKDLKTFAEDSKNLEEFSRGNEVLRSLPEKLSSLAGNIEGVVTTLPAAKMPEDQPEVEKREAMSEEDINKSVTEGRENISKLSESLFALESALFFSKESIEVYIENMPAKPGKVWIVDELTEKKILGWIPEIITNLTNIGESANYLYKFTEENEDLKVLLEYGKYPELLKELVGGGLETEEEKRNFITSLISIYESLEEQVKAAIAAKDSIFTEVDENSKKLFGEISPVSYDDRLEFITTVDDIVKQVNELMKLIAENIDKIIKNIEEAAQAKISSDIGREARETKGVKQKAAEDIKKMTAAINKGVKDFETVRKSLQNFVNNITKKPIDFKKLADEIKDITEDYNSLASEGVEIYGNIINGNFDYDSIGAAMDKYREALVEIVSDFPEFVRSKLTGAAARDIGKGILKGFGGIMSSLFGKSATKPSVGISTAAGYY